MLFSKIVRRISLPIKKFSTTAIVGANEGVRTPLYNYHVEKNGKLVNFSGYQLPVQYSDQSITLSHVHTRKFASIFDVSHMLQTYVRGKDVIKCFESLCTADLQELPNGSGTLTVFTNQAGGILDDLIVHKVTPELLYVVSNAARKEHDTKLMQSAVDKFKNQGHNVDIEFLNIDQQALIALQGPTAAAELQKVCDTKTDLSKLFFMTTTLANLNGIKNCRVTRCGYTGEDGFEISVPGDDSKKLVDALLNTSQSTVKLAGLGARDSLRLEAGLCLYGQDIDETTTPIEAGLTWLIGKRRRIEKNFPGAEIITNQIREGCKRKRIGLRITGGPPARSDVHIFIDSYSKESIGSVTSGCPAPSLGYNIAMGYVSDEYKKTGTQLSVKIRDKHFPAEVVRMPFTKTNYYQLKSSSK